MRRRNRRPLSDERETKKMIIISLSVLIISIIAFVVTFIIYNNYLNKGTQVAENRKNSITDLRNVNNTESLSQASLSIGKTINEVQEENVQSNQAVTNKIAINTSNMEKENINSENITTTSNTKVLNEQEAKPTTKVEKIPDPTFIKPVDGETTVNFAKDNLVYSNTLQEWVTHKGIDIEADKATIVKASAEGTVKSIKNDPRYGITVVVEHVNGYTSVYSNLLTAEFVKEGEKVKQSQSLGTVGNTAVFEIADEAHLHFEILKNGEQVDPALYIK
ncbi:MAG: M23 family metallopeptidase [Clostridiaceae bacterium]|nr:M23 family metallopeptidase [Clostridiaceae bacterium]